MPSYRKSSRHSGLFSIDRDIKLAKNTFILPLLCLLLLIWFTSPKNSATRHFQDGNTDQSGVPLCIILPSFSTIILSDINMASSASCVTINPMTIFSDFNMSDICHAFTQSVSVLNAAHQTESDQLMLSSPTPPHAVAKPADNSCG